MNLLLHALDRNAVALLRYAHAKFELRRHCGHVEVQDRKAYVLLLADLLTTFLLPDVEEVCGTIVEHLPEWEPDGVGCGIQARDQAVNKLHVIIC